MELITRVKGQGSPELALGRKEKKIAILTHLVQAYKIVLMNIFWLVR